MLYSSKCLTPAFLCCNIILFFSIHVNGQLPPFPLFPSPNPNTVPPISESSPPIPNTVPPISESSPPSPNTVPDIPGLSPPSPNMFPPISGLPPPILNPSSPNTVPGIPELSPPSPNMFPPISGIPGLSPPSPNMFPPISGIPGLSPPSPNMFPPIPGLPPPILNPLPPIPGQLTPPSVPEICPKNKVTMKIVCANVLGIPVMPISRTLNPLGTPCCKFIEGLIDIEVAVCFCRAITFNTSDPRTNIPVSLVLLLNYCQKELSHDFRCATT